MLDSEQTSDPGQHSVSGVAEEPVACWLMRSGETWGLDHGNLSCFMDVESKFGFTVWVSADHNIYLYIFFLLKIALMGIFCAPIERDERDDDVVQKSRSKSDSGDQN